MINKICQALKKTCLYFILKINRKNNAISLYKIKFRLNLSIWDKQNCCAGKGKEDQVDMERARQKEMSRQIERDRRMSKKKKRESAKQGARVREGKC